MGTEANLNFSDMLREYAPHTVIEDSFSKDNYLWGKLEKDKEWKDGVEYQIPVELSGASDFEMGALVSESNLGSSIYKKLTLSTQPQMTGAMVFNERDLKRYGNLKQSFLKLLPGEVNKFTRRARQHWSVKLLKGSLAIATADGTAGGEIEVDKPQYFAVGQRVEVSADSPATVSGFVTAIDMEAKTLTIMTARTAGSAVDLSGFAAADNTKVNIPGSEDVEDFTSFADYLLPASAGGSDTIYGINKSIYPILQPQVADGASYTASNITDKLTDFYYDVKDLGKVDAAEILVPFHVFKAFAKKIEANKRYMVKDKMSGVGFSSLYIDGPSGEMKLTALSDMALDKAFVINWEDFCFAGYRFLDKVKDPDGNEYHKIRSTSGYKYIVDLVLQGELIAKKLSGSAVIHSIPQL